MKRLVTFILLGAGKRGKIYAQYLALHPTQARLIGVAEPNAEICKELQMQHHFSEALIWKDWRDVLQQPRLADAVIISLQDSEHAEAAIAFAEKGYHILLEKPMATSMAEAEEMVRRIKNAGVMFAVCYPLRYSKTSRLLYRLIHQEKAIGDLVTVNHIEPIGLWRFSQNFVRGSWKNSKDSTFMLMSKACHDIDWLLYMINRPCRQVASFGSLAHFVPKNKPATAGENCCQCPCESTCVFSAKRFYLTSSSYRERLIEDLIGEVGGSEEEVVAALSNSPMGHCVYAGENDVVDHQNVVLSFEDMVTCTFTVTAFTPQMERQTYFMGTAGTLFCDGEKVHLFQFHSNRTEIYDPKTEIVGEDGHHDGGDVFLCDRFIQAVLENDSSFILSDLHSSYLGMKLIFDAEAARLSDKIADCTTLAD